MPNLTFEYHPEAIAEAWEAYHWYGYRSDSAAEAFWEELRAARIAATARPDAWATYLHGTRCCKLQRFPYGLVYIERDDRILAIAVAHFRRRPGYWRKRLAD